MREFSSADSGRSTSRRTGPNHLHCASGTDEAERLGVILIPKIVSQGEPHDELSQPMWVGAAANLLFAS